MSRKTHLILALSALTLISIGVSDSALASSGGGSLRWESPLQQIQQSITGPVAGFIALAAVAIAGAMLIFGGELNDFAGFAMSHWSAAFCSAPPRSSPCSAQPARRSASFMPTLALLRLSPCL